jgi:hypothetical protein
MVNRGNLVRASLVVVAATSYVVVGGSPSYAEPAPEPHGAPVSVWVCRTRVDAVAAALRDQGFASQAANNFGIFVRQECDLAAARRNQH